jgi:hypothetical protein
MCWLSRVLSEEAKERGITDDLISGFFLSLFETTANNASLPNAIVTILFDARPRYDKVLQRGTAHIMWLPYLYGQLDIGGQVTQTRQQRHV